MCLARLTRSCNQGMCERFHDRALLDFADGRAGISLFSAQARNFPIELDMMERHPEGSQAFVPMSFDPFVVVVAPDDNGAPGQPRAFITAKGQGCELSPQHMARGFDTAACTGFVCRDRSHRGRARICKSIGSTCLMA